MRLVRELLPALLPLTEPHDAEELVAGGRLVRLQPHDHRVPTISRFYGIAIQMFHKEHGIPHFHARYAGESASFSIEDLSVLEGSLPPRAERLVRDWAREHRAELLSNWRRARAGEPPAQIEPLR